MLKLIVSESYQ